LRVIRATAIRTAARMLHPCRCSPNPFCSRWCSGTLEEDCTSWSHCHMTFAHRCPARCNCPNHSLHPPCTRGHCSLYYQSRWGSPDYRKCCSCSNTEPHIQCSLRQRCYRLPCIDYRPICSQ
jgi:hypothetical protein